MSEFLAQGEIRVDRVTRGEHHRRVVQKIDSLGAELARSERFYLEKLSEFDFCTVFLAQRVISLILERGLL